MDQIATKLDGEGQEVKDEFQAIKKVLNEELEAKKILADVKRLRREAATSTTVGHWVRIKKQLSQFVQRYRGTRTYLMNSDGTSALE